MDYKTIVALATPPLQGALAIIRVSGDQAIELVNQIFSGNLLTAKTHTVHYGILIYDNQPIDEVMVSVFLAPRTYTRENMVEISTHGSMIIVEQVIAALVALGAREATRGEFTKRAYINGRIDLLQAEAINDIIHGETKEIINTALKGVCGHVSEVIYTFKNEIEDLIDCLSVNIDYPEYYDIEEVTHNKVKPIVDSLIIKCQEIIEHNKIGMVITNGLKVAIIGKPNVGKSSLLNALLEEEKAIVTEVAGTTRDIVEGKIVIDGILLHLLDTAGIRKNADQIETIGIEKTYAAIKDADIVLLVLDGSKELEEIDEELLRLSADKKRIIIINKADLPIKVSYPGIKISAINSKLDELYIAIKKVIGIEVKDYANQPLLTNIRHLGLILKVKEALESLNSLIEQQAPLDVFSIDLQLAHKAILDLLGEEVDIDGNNRLFSKFCVGK